MAETSFAQRVNKEATPERPWRNAFTGDNAGNFAPFCLSLQSSDGRTMEGPSMSLFTWHVWLDGGGPVEKLFLFFSVGAVYVEGLHMKAKVEAIFQEGKLKRIQQHDSLEIEAIKYRFTYHQRGQGAKRARPMPHGVAIALMPGIMWLPVALIVLVRL